MPEPCSIYSTRVAPFTLDEVRGFADGASVSQSLGPDGGSQVIVQWPGCALTFKEMPSGGLGEHLDGLRGYIWHCAKEMTPSAYALFQRTYLIHHCFGSVSDPMILPVAESFVRKLAFAGRGFVFRGNSLLDPALDPLCGPEGVAMDRLPGYWPDALDRRRRSIALLKSRGLATPETLPPVPGEHEVLLRHPGEVGRRAWALYAVAGRAVPNGIGRNAAWRLLQGHESALTPGERSFLNKYFLDASSKVQFGWRFEAIRALLWALGLVGELEFPHSVANVEAIDAVFNRMGLTGLLAIGALRPTADILDHLDLVYRCHWVATEARVKGKPTPDLLNPGVVLERHHALRWLTCHQGADWDDVRTDT